MIIGYILLGLGIVVFILSFLLPAKTEEEKEIEFSQDMIKEMVTKEVGDVKGHLNEIVDETISYAMEKTERSIDRLTNEKMMAVNEYSDNVLSEIDKSHQEVVFLYDMLNDKHETLKDTVLEMDKKTSEVKQAALDVELTAKEASLKLQEVKEQAAIRESMKEADSGIDEANLSAIDRLKNMKPVKEEDSFVPFEPQNAEVVKKPPKKKRTTKPKVREEAVVLSEGVSSLQGDFELITNAEIDAPRLPKDAPMLNLGTDGAGKALGGRNNNEKILELHNKGMSNMAIAKELGLGLGEVKLVIDLFEGM